MISNMKYRKNQDVGLFDKENTLQELLKSGNPLPKLKEIIDFERFRDILEPEFENTERKNNAGRNYTVCSASRHDSKETEHVLTEPSKEAYGEPAWLDAGYSGMEDVVRAKHMTPIICEKGRRGHPLTDEQKERNRQKSKVRSRVEHVFGFMEQTMGGLVFRGVGMIRAKTNIAMTNLVYNMCRLVQIKKYQPNLVTIQ